MRPEIGAKTKLGARPPAALLTMFPEANGLGGVATEVESTLLTITDDTR